jgi:hypothetical protein
MGLPLLTRAADVTVVVLLALSAQFQIWTRDAWVMVVLLPTGAPARVR